MTYKRIIPCLDVKDGRVVKGVNFVNFRDAGEPAEMAAQYVREGADELVFLDIAATNENRGIMTDMVQKIAKRVTIPFTVGGGIRTIDDIRAVLNAGANKVSIGTAAIMKPQLISDAATLFGSRTITLALDVRRGANGWTAYSNGGKTDTGIDVIDLIKKAKELGAGEVLLTSMDADGVKCGYDNKLYAAVTHAVDIPVIASGGAGTMQHFYDAIITGGVSAALAASVFHYGEIKISDLKQFLRNNGVSVREGQSKC